MKKQEYSKPVAETIVFHTADIITTSGDIGMGGGFEGEVDDLSLAGIDLP